MKLRNLLDSEQSLGRLLQLSVSAKMAYQLVMQFKNVEPHLKAGREAVMNLYRKYGEEKPQPDGVTILYQVWPVNMVQFQKELAELLETECDIQIKPINLNDLGDVIMSAADLMVLSWLIE